jgi:hypothetical protein
MSGDATSRWIFRRGNDSQQNGESQMKPDIPLVLMPGVNVGSGNVTDAVRAAHRGDLSMPVETTWKAPGEFDVRLAPAVGAFIAANPAVEEERLAAALGAPVRVVGVRRTKDGPVVTLHVPHERREDTEPWLQEVSERYQLNGEVPGGWTAGGDPVYSRAVPALPAGTREIPAVLRAAITYITDFEPENDTALHEFLGGFARGMDGISEAVTGLHDHCLSQEVRLGKGAVATLGTCAETGAALAGVYRSASAMLDQYYGGVTEEVAGGVELPRDGDFITGNGAGG